jgi:hypothetical protein
MWKENNDREGIMPFSSQYLMFNFFICWILCASCGHPFRNSSSGNETDLASGGTQCGAPQKITAIYRENVYDLSGYSDDKGNPFNLFDENAYVEPAAGTGLATGYHPVTSPQPLDHQSIYYPLGKGSRIVTDMVIPYELTDVYIFDRSRQPDSVWLYTGDPRHWKLQAGFTSGATAPGGAWRRFRIQDSSRYLMLRMSSFETDITEMVMYGCPLGAVPGPPSSAYKGQRLPKKIMKEFLGVNYVMESELQWLKPFHYNRLYNVSLDYDNDTVHRFPDVRFNMLHYGYWDNSTGDYHFNVDDIKASNGSEVWYSLRGVPMWMDRKGYTDRDRPVTMPGMDPENPMSYARHARLMWNFASFFGSQAVDTGLLLISNSPRRSGRSTMDVFENGNEEDGTWLGNRYCNPVSYFAQSSADFDGHEGRLGQYSGIRAADSNSRLMTSGMTELDTNRVRTYQFLCNTLRDDKQFIWKGGIQYHHYSGTGKRALTPEEDSLRWKLTSVRDATYRIVPGVQCILGENGYDKSPASPQGAPPIPGQTPGECQGIYLLRSINATAFSGFDAYILFWLRDSDPPDNPQRFATCGIIGPASKGAGTKPYPAWFYISTFVNRLGDYVPDTIVSEKGNVWIYKYRHQKEPDSVAYFLYCPTRNGSVVRDYPLHTGLSADCKAMQILFSDSSEKGNAAGLQVSNGAVHINVEERPVLVFLKERKK